MLLVVVMCLILSVGRTGKIKIGMSTALSGSLKEVGQDMRLGIETYFDRVNQTGGVKGNFLKLIVMAILIKVLSGSMKILVNEKTMKISSVISPIMTR